MKWYRGFIVSGFEKWFLKRWYLIGGLNDEKEVVIGKYRKRVFEIGRIVNGKVWYCKKNLYV